MVDFEEGLFAPSRHFQLKVFGVPGRAGSVGRQFNFSTSSSATRPRSKTTEAPATQSRPRPAESADTGAAHQLSAHAFRAKLDKHASEIKTALGVAAALRHGAPPPFPTLEQIRLDSRRVFAARLRRRPHGHNGGHSVEQEWHCCGIRTAEWVPTAVSARTRTAVMVPKDAAMTVMASGPGWADALILAPEAAVARTFAETVTAYGIAHGGSMRESAVDRPIVSEVIALSYNTSLY